jgi:hypothetical protein
MGGYRGKSTDCCRRKLPVLLKFCDIVLFVVLQYSVRRLECKTVNNPCDKTYLMEREVPAFRAVVIARESLLLVHKRTQPQTLYIALAEVTFGGFTWLPGANKGRREDRNPSVKLSTNGC